MSALCIVREGTGISVFCIAREETGISECFVYCERGDRN